MQLLDSQGNIAAGNTYLLQAKGMPAQKFVKKFTLKLFIQSALGGGPLAHQQEAVAQCISKLKSTQGVLDVDISARRLAIAYAQGKRSRNAQNPEMDGIGSDYILYVKVDPAALFGSPDSPDFRYATSQLQDQNFNISLANPFAAADRIPTFTKIELWGEFTNKGPSKPFTKTTVIKEITGIPSDKWVLNDTMPTMVLFNQRDDGGVLTWDKLNIEMRQKSGGSMLILEDGTSLDLDDLDEEYDVDLFNDDRTVGGNQLLQNILDADGVTVENYTKIYDTRRGQEREGVLPLNVRFTSKQTNDIVYVVIGTQ